MLCHANYGLGAYCMELVHNREPDSVGYATCFIPVQPCDVVYGLEKSQIVGVPCVVCMRAIFSQCKLCLTNARCHVILRYPLNASIVFGDWPNNGGYINH